MSWLKERTEAGGTFIQIKRTKAQVCNELLTEKLKAKLFVS
jgi:hypothetical protein